MFWQPDQPDLHDIIPIKVPQATEGLESGLASRFEPDHPQREIQNVLCRMITSKTFQYREVGLGRDRFYSYLL